MSLSKIFVNNTKIVGVDDEPTAGSDNLVKSGGVQNLYFDLVGTGFATGAFQDTQSDAITENTDFVYSKIFIPVKSGDIIHWKYSENGFIGYDIFAMVYNSQKEVINYYSMNVANERDFIISKTEFCYMRFCFRKDSINSVYVAINNKIVLTYKEKQFFDIKDKRPLSVEEYKNVINKLKIGETSVETTFTMTPGAAHSSQIDRLETLIPKGTIVAVKVEGDFKEGTANQIFYRTIENTGALYGGIKLNEYNLLSFDDTVTSVGVTISAQDTSTNVIFTLTSESSIIDELCNSGYRAALNNNINTLEATVEKASSFVTFYDDKYVPLFKKGDIVRFVFDNKESLTNQQHLLIFQKNSNQYSIDSDYTATTITIPEDVYKLTSYVRTLDFIKAGKIALRYTTSTDDLKKRERQYSEVIRSTLNLTAGAGHSSSLDRITANIPANVPFTVSITNDTAIIEGSSNMQIWAKDVDGGSQGPITFSTGEVVLVRFEKEITDFGITVAGTSIINSGIANVVTKIGVSLVDIEEYTKQTPLRENTIASSYNDVNIDSKLALFASHFVGTTQRTEPFLFFTDPHLYFDTSTVTHGISELDRQEAMSLIQKAFNKSATKFVLCGGDWLTAHKGTEAYTYLSWIDGIMNGLFQDNYYMINGNHDNNYQGKNTYGEEGGETIPNQEMVNLLYSRFGTNKLYYSFKGNATRFYILDTGIDWNEEMNEYRWEQIDWLANQLLTTSDIDIAIGMHIITNRGGIEGWMDNIAPMTDNVTKLLDSYNKKTSITLNGTTYNFAEAKGTVHFIIAGHAHYDFDGIINGIPIIGTMNVKPNYLGHNITFDLVLADYNANKLYLTRIGQGSSREIDIL